MGGTTVMCRRRRCTEGHRSFLLVALALGSSPSFGTFLANSESVAFNACALFGLCSGPLAMYVCLVHWTGATPAEFFSMENRPDYARYCEKVNCFFPGPRKE